MFWEKGNHYCLLLMSQKDNLNPWYISGLIEGEGCFCITISKHKTKKLGCDARLMFEIEMIFEDRPLLEKVQEFFKCGNLYDLNYERYGWRPHVKYAVRNLAHITEVIIPFFKKYSLQGKKAKDFEKFCLAAESFKKKEHLTLEGIKKLRRLQQQMNTRCKLKQ